MPDYQLQEVKMVKKQKMLPFCFLMLRITITFAAAKLLKTLNNAIKNGKKTESKCPHDYRRGE